MAKAKNKRNSGLADKVHGKRKSDQFKKKLNPFEVHINKEKIKVLGKKSKHDRGLPGVSRAKAIQKRKETLGTEMRLMHKTNAFIDRRIGEKNTQLSAEDKMVARFAAERAKQHSRKNIYNLADEEILTHRGQTLEQIEKFDDPRSSDDEDDDGKKGFGGLDNDFVSEGHFGGGVLAKSEKDGAKSHKDLIEQLIAESKKRKAEKQKEKEQTLDLTEKLDSEWKDLQPVVFKRARKESDKEGESIIDKLLSQAEKRGADYDKMMRELKFDRRGTPSDGLKNDEKQAKEEREKLERLERERQLRMLADDDVAASKTVQAKPKHRSADDLDDNFVMEDEKELMLAYDKDGNPLVPEHVLKDYSVPNAKPKFEDGISDTSSEEGDDNDDEEVDEESKSEEINKNRSDGEENIEGSDKEGSKDEAGEVEESESGVSDNEDDKEVVIAENTKANKIKEPKNESKQNVKNTQETNQKQSKNYDENTILFQNVDKNGSDDENDSGDGSDEDSEESDSEQEKEEQKDDFKDLKESDVESESEEEVEGDSEKIETFFDMKTGEGNHLKELLTDKTPAQISIAIQKLIKSYDPSLAENNKDKLSRLYAHMLQYTNDLFTGLNNEGDVVKAFLIFDRLAPHFYDLAHTNKVSTKKFLVELLKEKYDKFKKNPKRVPDLDTLIFFKLISLLYPTSDFRHPVTTPSLIFMSEILTLSKFNSAYAISRGFFITALILEYTVLSKRFVPSAINFLRGILYLTANTSILNPIQVVPPFRLHKDAKVLNLEHDCSKMEVGDKMAAKDLVLNEIDDDFKIRCLVSCTLMLKEFFVNFNDIEAQEFIFEPHLQLYSRIDVEIYPKKVSNIVVKTVQYMKEGLEVKTYTPLSREKKKPKALRLYEPDFQEVFTGNKSSKMPREMAERKRLQGKVKKEMKGALREIRRDKAYIASVKIRQKIQSDNIRKDKVKQIYKDASIQQGELNKLQRMK